MDEPLIRNVSPVASAGGGSVRFLGLIAMGGGGGG